jgi:hypothetical protein|tara:strand:- start:421 stop:693 length:273 start_codon:yes stop_codon:yes gene_type:complete
MIRLVEVVKQFDRFDLREVFVNPRHVVSLREDGQARQALTEGRLPEGLDPRQDFTKLTLDKGTVGLELTIVGSPSVVESKLKSQKQVLNG